MLKLRTPLFLLLVCLLFVHACSSPEDRGPYSETYRKAVSDFYVSLAASQTDEARFAFNKMNNVANLYPEEPAAWANLAVFAMRQGNFDLSVNRISRALELAPNHPDVLFLSGYIFSQMGDVDSAVEQFRTGAEIHPEHLKLNFALIQELERQDDVRNADEIFERLRNMHQSNPQNSTLHFELLRVAAKERKTEETAGLLSSLKNLSINWPEPAGEQFKLLHTLLDERDFAELSFELLFLRNLLETTPQFQFSVTQLALAPTEVGFFITEFIHLPKPKNRVAEPDIGLGFTSQVPENARRKTTFTVRVTLLDELPPLPIFIYENQLYIGDDVRLSVPHSLPENELHPHQLLAEIDYNYNFRNDIALAGNKGFRLYHHNDDYTFTDITENLGLSDDIINGNYLGVWAADFDLDGDLDLILSPAGGAPFGLRNNTDGSFSKVALFDGITDAIDFMYADLDGDGAMDAIFLTKTGELKLFKNLRANKFQADASLQSGSAISAFTLADITANGFFDILAVTENSSVKKISYHPAEDNWISSELIERWQRSGNLQPGQSRIFSADIDNNGSLDIIVSTHQQTAVWLSDSAQNFYQLDRELPAGITSVFDIDGNERLDLLGVSLHDGPFQLMNSGTKNYNAYSIRARASGLEGDQRINSFGIGGEMEIRTELLYQKQLITSPIVHFGLGEYTEAEMLRINWPNGSVQTEFAELGMGSTIFNEQVLKGSCPWLFTHDGHEFHFITDILWRSPLGLRINAQETAGVIQTLDRVRVPGDKLRAVDGVYDFRITAELWETHFFDYVSLLAVDHPADTKMFIDERFVFPAPDLSTRILGKPQPVASVVDDKGRNWTSTIRQKDGNYMVPFTKTSYQGLVEPHYIEITIGENAPADEPIWLVASGWLRPTDSSINLALSQGAHEPPSWLHVKVQNANGDWKTLHESYGIPAGKLKTILLDLGDAFEPGAERKLRFYTTSEIYWDAIQWAVDRNEVPFTEIKLTPKTMDLRFRGYSRWFRPDESSPKLAEYSEISGTHPRWRDLEGFHTRYGDVSELLADIDDRYVIMNAGDEMHFEFEALPPPQEGMVRSYILVTDGWVKDGDYNTEASRTVHPLPYHGQSDYEYNHGGNLWEDPIYQQHRTDWIKYHTRYITPEPFRSALVFD